MTLSWIKSMAKMISFLNLALFSNFLISFSLQAQTLISLDASGRSGENGSVEHDYSTRRGSASGRGRSGNSASPSTPGQSGGLIDVLMKDLSPDGSIEPQKVFISISGTVGPGLVDQKLEYMPSSQFILFDVHGGRGGNGGQGGDGEGGCNGRDGRDATRSFSGENGTDGCPGGDGGSGTPGSDGGAGGKIRIHMDQKDTHLLMLVKTDISGGPPGDPGKNGRPGEGGRGGQGGSSYSWTTTRVVGKRCDPDRMVNNGNGSRTVQKGACHDVTTTDRHTQSGGFDGRNGADGVIKSGPVNGGTQGLDGQFQITIHQEAGPSQTFTRPYNLVLRSFTMEDENHDGIFEPGEKVFVSGIKVQNIGEIPTPKGKSDVLIFLGSSEWIIADPLMLKAPQIEAGKEYTFPDPLTFVIRNNKLLGTDRRAEAEDRVLPIAKVTRVEKTFDGFHLPKTLTVTYPIEITPIDLRPSIGPGEKAHFVWKVKNLSLRSYGIESELKRALSTSLNVRGGDARRDQISLNGNDRFIKIISELPAGGEAIIEGEISIGSQALPYTSFELDSSLNLQTNRGSELKEIQINNFKIRVAQVYKYNASSSLLLLADKDSNREEILAWIELSRRLGLEIDIWDVSYYGYFSLTQYLKKENKSIAELYAHKTIIVPIGSQASGAEPRAFDFLSRYEFLREAEQNQLNMVVLGGELGSENQITASLFKPDKLLSMVKVEEIENAMHLLKTQEGLNETDLRFNGIEIEVQATQFSEPVQLDLVRRAQEFLDDINREFPTRGFRVKSQFIGERTEEGKLLDTYRLGTMEVIPIHQRNSGRLVALSVPERELHSVAFISSKENLRAILLGLSLETKLSVFLRALQSKDSFLRVSSRDALVYELAFRMETATLNSQRDNPDLQDLLGVMANWEGLGFEPSSFSSDSTEVFELMAAIDLFSDEVLSGPSKKAVQKAWEATLRPQLLAALSPSFSNSKFEPIEEKIKQARENYSERAKARKKILPGINKKDNYRHMLLWPALHRARGTDRDLYQDRTVF